ncbi:hypothetical protein [Brasilonema sp. UFV-L1]|uniref:hypothetical protein n=1 Tax=Brasilonema sp. UFV-L1 TaxID=2234130 RepID=UPI00145C6B17|nr:hypothetical protein [Brasilonema sp. UFV-L1]NMG10104.1 hypothetical protein [Brasilonema sp. UFV-L1]
MISTRHLESMPDRDTLESLSQSLAMLDAIIMPEWELRYYSFNSKWSKGEKMASMQNGSGDGYFALFSKEGAILKGFVQQAWEGEVYPGVLDNVPEVFLDNFINEPAFSMESTSFCVWRLPTDSSWQVGNIDMPSDLDDGSSKLLSIFEDTPTRYKNWAEQYYEIVLPQTEVLAIFQHRPLSNELIQAINPDNSLEDLAEDILEIGYPKN